MSENIRRGVMRVTLLIALVFEAHAMEQAANRIAGKLTSWPLHRANLKNMTLGKVGQPQVSYGRVYFASVDSVLFNFFFSKL